MWNVVGKTIIRGLSIVSTLVLVRLLSPEDFGIMAMATIMTEVPGGAMKITASSKSSAKPFSRRLRK